MDPLPERDRSIMAAFDMINEQLAGVAALQDQWQRWAQWQERRTVGDINPHAFNWPFAVTRHADSEDGSAAEAAWPICAVIWHDSDHGKYTRFQQHYLAELKRGAYDKHLQPGTDTQVIHAAETARLGSGALDTNTFSSVELRMAEVVLQPKASELGIRKVALSWNYCEQQPYGPRIIPEIALWMWSEGSKPIDGWCGAAIQLLDLVGIKESEIEKLDVYPLGSLAWLASAAEILSRNGPFATPRARELIAQQHEWRLWENRLSAHPFISKMLPRQVLAQAFAGL
ncbi:hypothetical protein WJX72_006366 [[Myrmecia] bisecta]|uniref:Uncharacterized protein n=1 Tax=[Myrmecia] bisecta TaxID=41462 RepID=A0AAW1PYM2_9CHLO